MWAAKLSDPEMIDLLVAEVMEKGPVTSNEMRPALRGFDPVVSKLHDLTNQIISLRMEQGNPKLKHMAGPLFPMEIADERLRARAKAKREAAIEKAQAQWREPQPAVIDA